MDIRALLIRIATGDKQAFADIVTHYQRPLFGFLGRMALSQALAEEIAQETFIRAWAKLGEYRPEKAEFSTWLFTIARNLALNELARAASQREHAAGDDLPERACERLQPPDILLHAERRQQLQNALHQLALPERSVLALAYVQEFELSAIARIEGCSTGAAKTRLHRAREKLRQLLEKHDG